MPDTLRIAFTGPGSTGKSTLAKMTAESLGLEFIDSPIKEMQKKLGFDINTGDVDERIRFQYAIMQEQARLEHENPRAIFARAWVDYAAYFKYFFPNDSSAYLEFAESSSTGYDFHFGLRYGCIPRSFEEGRFANEEVEIEMDKNMMTIAPKMIIIHETDPDERVQKVIDTVKSKIGQIPIF